MLNTLPINKRITSKLLLLALSWWLVSMLAISLTLAALWRLEGAGAAINDAGSLRMQAYRIALLITQNIPKQELQSELNYFGTTLQGIISGNKKRPLFLPKKKYFYDQALLIQSEWKVLSSLIISHWYNESPQRAAVSFNVSNIDQFVAHIDELVILIEKDNASRLMYLRAYQYLLYALVMIGILSTFYLFLVLIIRPLTNLNQGMLFITKGQLSYRIEPQQNDEFGLLGAGFNQMATRLEDLYNHLEEKVSEKTSDLAQRNDTLNNLYQLTALMHKTHDITELCQTFLKRVIPLMGAQAATIRFINSEQKTFDLTAACDLPEALVHHPQCYSANSCLCHKQSVAELQSTSFYTLNVAQEKIRPLCAHMGYTALIVFPLSKGSEQLGELTLFFANPQPLTEEQVNLLTTLSSHLCGVIHGLQTQIQLRQIAVLEERNMLAQGLHDSIAQVLTFLNIQVQMLARALQQNNQTQSQDSLAAINNGIQECYTNVRELLLNFRMPEKKGSFHAIVGEIIARFEAQTGTNVAVEMTPYVTIEINKAMEIAFILQEGLSNIRKHAKANEVTLSIQQTTDFILNLQDNGIGFDQQILQDKSLEHVGMAIMHERAQKINATLAITAKLGVGTKLLLKLPNHKAHI